VRYVYILRSERDRRYVGVTTDLLKRLAEHNAGKNCSTAKYRPWEIVYFEKYPKKAEALRRERQLKKWSAKKKDALISGDLKLLKMMSKRKS